VKPVRFLFTTNTIEWPPATGTQIRQWRMLQGLLQAGPTDAIVFQRDDVPLPREAYAGCGRVIAVSERHLNLGPLQQRLYASTLGRAVLTFGTPYPFEYATHRRSELRRDLLNQLDFSDYDLIWLSRARIAMALASICTAPTVLDGDAFDYVREWLTLRASPWYGAKILNYLNVAKLYLWERHFNSRFTRVLRCSLEDKNRHPAKNVTVVPNGTSVSAEPAERTPERRLLFVGLLGYGPNQQGLEWFLANVWPLIRRAVPDAQCDIAGRGASAKIQQMHGREGVILHGFVADLEPLYRRAGAAIAPLLAGAGTKLKVLEALGHAVPVVTTTVGAFGIGASQEQGLLIADSARDFATRCVEAIQSPSDFREAGAAGQRWVRDHYDWRAIQTEVARLVLDLVSARQPASRKSYTAFACDAL
jgi:glycosyltransferase involved in cell wall biosynthesis